MTIVSAQEYESLFSELQCLKENFASLEHENERLSEDLHQIIVEKQQTQQLHGELALRVQQLEATIVCITTTRTEYSRDP